MTSIIQSMLYWSRCLLTYAWVVKNSRTFSTGAPIRLYMARLRRIAAASRGLQPVDDDGEAEEPDDAEGVDHVARAGGRLRAREEG